MDWKEKAGNGPAAIVTGGISLLWLVERIIGLAGIPDDFATWLRAMNLIPTPLAMFALGAFTLFLWARWSASYGGRLSPKQNRIIGELAAYAGGNIGITAERCAKIWTANPRKLSAIADQVQRNIKSGVLEAEPYPGIEYGVISIRNFTEFLINKSVLDRSSVLKHAPLRTAVTN